MHSVKNTKIFLFVKSFSYICNMKEIYQTDLSYACAGIIVEDDIIVDSAPIFSWAKRKHMNKIKKWVINKGGKITKIE